MEDLKKQIKEELKILEEMIENKEEKNKIDNQRKKLDSLLEKFVKDLQ